MMNMFPVARIAALFQVIGQESRLQILLAIGEGETCVCHLEAMLGLRQATLSQHLMALREAELVADRRAGRYVYYRLAELPLLGLIRQAAEIAGVQLPAISPSEECECPSCRADESCTGNLITAHDHADGTESR